MMKSPKTCSHYGISSPVLRPLMYLTQRGQVIRCPFPGCGRCITDKNSRRAVRRWNKSVREEGNSMGLLSKAEKIQERRGDEIYGRSPLVDALPVFRLRNEAVRIQMELLQLPEETNNRIRDAIMSPPDRLDGLAVKKTCIYHGLFDETFSEGWKTVMKRAGCKFIEYIKKVRRETRNDNPDDIYDIITVYLEKEYPTGTLRSKAEVDVEILKLYAKPEIRLCAEMITPVAAMDMEAKRKIEEGL